MPTHLILPFLFIILWSSAFISGKAIMADATPFLALLMRFAIVGAGFAALMGILQKSISLERRAIFDSLLVGVLFHGIYLGGVFWSMSNGMPAAIAALIVSLQPVITAILAGPILGEQVGMRQKLGVILGFIGAGFVIGLDVGSAIPVAGVIVCLISLGAITGGTLYQKRRGSQIPVMAGNLYQAIGGALFHLIFMSLFEVPSVAWTTNFIVGMAWQILAVSGIAWLILLILLKRGTASQTTALFFLVPPTAALMGYVVLAEPMTGIDIGGMILASLGVYIATRPQSEITPAKA